MTLHNSIAIGGYSCIGFILSPWYVRDMYNIIWTGFASFSNHLRRIWFLYLVRMSLKSKSFSIHKARVSIPLNVLTNQRWSKSIWRLENCSPVILDLAFVLNKWIVSASTPIFLSMITFALSRISCAKLIEIFFLLAFHVSVIIILRDLFVTNVQIVHHVWRVYI